MTNTLSHRQGFRRLAALALALSLTGAACASDEDPVDDATAAVDEAADEATDTAEDMADEADDMAEDDMAEDDMAEDDMADDEMSQTIVDVAAGNEDFSILVQAVTTAGLAETLSGEGPFTVFAPNNDAFAAALADLDITAEELLAMENLGDILTYHVVPGAVMAADVVGLDGQTVETVNGETVTITVDGDTVMVNGATVIMTDIEASNGVIHVIDSVLLPPS